MLYTPHLSQAPPDVWQGAHAKYKNVHQLLQHTVDEVKGGGLSSSLLPAVPLQVILGDLVHHCIA